MCSARSVVEWFGPFFVLGKHFWSIKIRGYRKTMVARLLRILGKQFRKYKMIKLLYFSYSMHILSIQIRKNSVYFGILSKNMLNQLMNNFISLIIMMACKQGGIIVCLRQWITTCNNSV